MTVRYKPNTTVAWIVKSPAGYLFVEEHKQGEQLFNQPAGHIEEGETLLKAAERELYEETGVQASPTGLVGIYQFPSRDRSVAYLRFCFYLELEKTPEVGPNDPDITACHWLQPSALKSLKLRSPYVQTCLDDYLQGQRFPLSLLNCQL